MAAAPGLAHELVIGIGSAAIRSSRLGEIERVVGRIFGQRLVRTKAW